MKLVSLKIKNYRSYSGEYTIEFDKSFTSFIGKNDVGKSTIFEVLDIFFGNKKPDIYDLCVEPTDKYMAFTCIFSELPKTLEIDATAPTSLYEEHLLNENRNLEIRKVYKCTDKSVSTSPEIYIVANYPSNKVVPALHTYNQSQLKELGETRGVSVLDARINSYWRKGIWDSFEDLRLCKTDLKIDEFEPKAKKIYSKIEEYLPLFFVFRSDREMTDADSEAKDPMQLAVAEAQMKYQEEIDVIKDKIQSSVEEVAEEALNKLHEIDPRLADQLKPVLKSKPSWKFDYRIEDEHGIALNKRGSGTRRLVLLNFFRAQAEKESLSSSKGIIYAIEEPETSQHPDNQILVIKALRELSQDEERQVMITTHSPELLRSITVTHSDGIRFIQENADGTRDIISGKDGLILSANALGILNKQMFDSAEKILLVEGKTDCLFLEHASKAMKEEGEITNDFQELKIEVLPLGGKSGVQEWVILKKHQSLGLETFVFLDSDRESGNGPKTKNELFIESLVSDTTINGAYCTQRREIENYIKKELTGCEYSDYDDVKKIVPIKTGVNKRKLIEQFWTQMKSEDIPEEIKDIIRKVTNQP